MNVNEACAEVTVSTSGRPASPKKEEPVQNNDNNDASVSPNRSSPEPGCPICLGKLENKSFTDSCLHQFCFKCLLEWSKVKAECPLCKQSFKSIIHNVRSIEDYEQYYLSTTSTEGTLYVSREIFRLDGDPMATYREPYRFRTTAVSSYLDYFVRLEEAISHRVIPPGPAVSGGLLWQRRRQRGTSDFRRNIYQQGLWVLRTADVTGRVRECSPEFYRANPAQVHRLVPWLNRELNVLLYENSPHIQHVMSRILELITQVPIRSPGFASVIAPYIGRHTEHFVHEFHAFAVSPFDMMGYDRHANYVGRSELGDYGESDSDVQVLGEGTRPHSPPIQIVDTDDSDDCIVLDVPSRSEPEVITLDSSDDDDVVQISIQNGHSQPTTSNQSSQPVASTSQQKPSTSRRPRLKRNWLTVNNVQVPSTSSEGVNGCEISISIAHSSGSVSPSVSVASTASWVPVRRKPTKVKKKETKKRKSKGKAREKKEKAVVSESDDSSPIPAGRVRRAVALTSGSSSDSDSDSDRTVERVEVKPREQEPHMTSTDSDSDRLHLVTESSSSDEEFKPRLRSVVVKSVKVEPMVKTEPRAASPAYFSYSRSESRDYDSPFSSRYSDLPSSRSRSDSYRSVQSHRSRRDSSSTPERLPSKKCKHSKKRSKRDK